MKGIIKVILFLIFTWCVVSAVRPYWNRHGLEKELKTASIYGTKNSIEDTRKYLDKKMKDEGYWFKGQDVIIEKNENNTVSISITYNDEISIFGVTLKELEFTVEKTSSEVKGAW